MASEWRIVSVDEIKARSENALVTGPFGSAISSRYFVSAGVPVIRGSNLSEDIGVRLRDEDLVFLDAEKATEFRRSVVREGDLIFTCWGTIGQVGLIDKRSKFREYVISNKQMKLTPDPAKADSLYLYYAFSGPELVGSVRNQAIGSSVPGFNLGQLRSLKLSLPPLDEQRAIAQILGTLDDKIELNRRMNETLEAIARAIFKSWFVDFDPVRAKAEGRLPLGMDAETAAIFPDSFQDSSLGKIPKGWRVGTVDEGFDLTMGQSPPGSTYNELAEGIPFFQGRADFGFRYPTERVYCTAPTRFANRGDTLVSVRAPVGDINMAMVTCAIGRGLAALRHKTGSRSFTYYAMKSLQGEFARFEGEGTVFGSISKHGFASISCVLPPVCLVDKFEQFVFPLDQGIENNETQSKTVAAVRDLLLPKLISGEIRVKEAEKFVEARL